MVETYDQFFDVSAIAIKDKSMLGTHGEELCNNLDVHWMTLTCSDDKNATSKFLLRMIIIIIIIQRRRQDLVRGEARN